MSALPPKADIDGYGRDVRFVPIADIGSIIRSPRRQWQAKSPGGTSIALAGLTVGLDWDNGIGEARRGFLRTELVEMRVS
jgi:hypothetical protein